jgi:predicted TIM-barrel fold metal-dependent hydrolase
VDEVTLMDSMDMSPADKTKFFQTNAETVFKIS